MLVKGSDGAQCKALWAFLQEMLGSCGGRGCGVGGPGLEAQRSLWRAPKASGRSQDRPLSTALAPVAGRASSRTLRTHRAVSRWGLPDAALGIPVPTFCTFFSLILFCLLRMDSDPWEASLPWKSAGWGVWIFWRGVRSKKTVLLTKNEAVFGPLLCA